MIRNLVKTSAYRAMIIRFVKKLYTNSYNVLSSQSTTVIKKWYMEYL
jgi:hypothetical protein